MSNVTRVRKLYKIVLRLHRGLPDDLRSLGDVYAKDEFRRHRTCSPPEAKIFLSEWTEYAIALTRQLGLKGSQVAKAEFGVGLSQDKLDNLRDEQILQLHELLQETTKPIIDQK